MLCILAEASKTSISKIKIQLKDTTVLLVPLKKTVIITHKMDSFIACQYLLIQLFIFLIITGAKPVYISFFHYIFPFNFKTKNKEALCVIKL